MTDPDDDEFAAMLRPRVEQASVQVNLGRMEPSAPALPDDASPADLLSRNTNLALRRQGEVLERSVDAGLSPKEQRLILETAAITLRSAIRVSEHSLRKRDENKLADILEKMQREEQQLDAERRARGTCEPNTVLESTNQDGNEMGPVRHP